MSDAITEVILDDSFIQHVVEENMYSGGAPQIIKTMVAVRDKAYQEGVAAARECHVDHVELNDGDIEDYQNIRTVADLKQILDGIDDTLPVRDFQGHSLTVTVYKPSVIKAFVEVQ